MATKDSNHSILDMLRRNMGRRILAVMNERYGLEGTLVAVSEEPAGFWLSNVSQVPLQRSVSYDIPPIIHDEERGEIFINLKSVLKVEIA